MTMHELSEEQAMSLYRSNWWMGRSDREIAGFQLFVEQLTMPFGEFHRAVEAALGRPVWSHEFAFVERLQAEFLGERAAPTLDEVIALIPPEKRIVIGVREEG